MKAGLLEQCSQLGIKVTKSMSVKTLRDKISEYQSKGMIEIRGDTQVKWVYHLADIHIRYIDRHAEYKEVFEKLIEFIKNDKNRENSIMVVCGDIFHNRDRFVSETIIVFDSFLREISELVKVFIILGNHDCFNHRDRLDALSGIMHVKKYANVHLLKESGYYRYSNIIFGVSGILDGAITKCPEKSSDSTYIGLYHGIVTGCSLDNEHKMNGISLDNFKNYDIVMLGDVHKRQFLDKKKTIAYPGSLIQQNFKEEREHGFLIWDLECKTSEFVVIPNDYSFINLDIKEDIRKVQFSKHSRVRVMLDLEDLESDIKEFTEALKDKTNVLSVKSLFKERVLQCKEREEYDEKSNVDTREGDIIKSLLTENEDFDDIMRIHNQLANNIEHSDLNYKNTLPWTIKELEFMNIFCYGDDHMNKIVLNSGITGILAANASGKTNILNTILYGLFGNIYTRNQNQNNRNIVSRFSKKGELYVKLTIEINGELLFIERRAKNRKRNTPTGEQTLLSETVDFYTEEKSLNLANKLETERCIRETLSFSTKDDFILTNMISNISYGSGISIISMNGAQLDEIFNSMFNLNKYKLLHNESKTFYKKLTNEKGILDGKISLLESKMGIDIRNEKSKLTKALKELAELTQTKRNLSTKLEEIYDRISNINKKNLDILDSKEHLIKKLNEDLELLGDFDPELLDREDYHYTEWDRITILLRDSEFLKMKKVEGVEERDIAQIERDISFYEGKKQKITFSTDITEEYIKAKKTIQAYKKEDKLDLVYVKRIISNMKYDSVAGHYTLDSDTREILLRDLEKTYISIDEFSKYQKIIDDKEKRDSIVNENIKIQQTLTALKTELKNNKINEAHKLKEKLLEHGDCIDSINLYYDTVEAKNKLKILEENNEYSKSIEEKNQLTVTINTLDSDISKLNSSISFLEHVIKSYEENLLMKNSLQAELKKTETESYLYKRYTEITHSKNLPKQLISNIVKNICTEANKLIYNSCGLLCHIQENEKWEIVIKKGNIYIGPEHCSGYERFVINISLKIAFDRFKQLPTIKLFLIDEVIDCVSEDNFEQIDALLSHLKRQYSNVFLISHNEELKKKVENRIEIRVDNNCSFIV
jgi:DNA repair exonuclease SbcCD ATPase subunit/DNA repair exonuclease SbcCD nuclease subunit